ncbi:MAG: PQQ-binding-like beta-propeller repeat protein [Candidatus Thermoplasmatota archaeon]|nr:PQQ-binding-like beta-propeller repeat protein [Candidatus Thermoplasmatota archaeon]
MERKIFGLLIFMLLTASVVFPAQGTIPVINQPADDTGDQILDDVEWWPMFHHDVQLTGYTPSDSPDMNMTLWDSQIDSDIWFSSPAVVNDDLFIGTGERYGDRSNELSDMLQYYDTTLFMKDRSFSDILKKDERPLSSEIGKLYRLNAKTGEILWAVEAEGFVFSSPTVADGLVYFVSTDSYNYSGRLYCLNTDTGTEVWSLPVMSGFATPTLYEGRLFVLTINPDDYFGRLQCLNAADGNEIWNHTTGYIDFSLYTAPAIADGKVFFTSIDVTTGIHCKISCLNLSTGQLLWDTKMSEMNFGYALSSPVIQDQKAYVISADTQGIEEFWCMLTCFDTENGSILWNYTMKQDSNNELCFSSPAVGYGNVYFALVGESWTYGKIVCLNGENGTVQWVYKSNEAYTGSSPILSSGKVFVGGLNMTLFEGNLYCLDALTGVLLYTAFIDNSFVDSTPAIAANTIFVGAQAGKISAFKDAFQVGEIKGGFLTVKLEITNVEGYDIQDVHYSMSVVGGLFHHINIQMNNTIAVLEAQTTDTIKTSPIIGLGKIQISISVWVDEVSPVIRTAEALVLGIFVIIR